ncbi:MAG: MBL fold metallo-hydrolase [Chloroflexi bacterium]|nr:MBL fold metallo-hydrolase [Chloroflexota bacterium]
MPIKIHLLPLGALQTNCYIVADTDTHEAVIIDPSDEAPKILEVVQREGYGVREILATHAHFDHVLASKPVKDATQAPFRLHAADVPQLQHAQQIATMYGITAPESATHDGIVDEGTVIEVGSIRLETYFTPGHSPGHVSYVLRSEQVVFSGDCLFAGGIGRTDLPGGDYPALMHSIFDKLVVLGDEYTVCSGHGPTTTIGEERQSNPFLLQWISSSWRDES